MRGGLLGRLEPKMSRILKSLRTPRTLEALGMPRAPWKRLGFLFLAAGTLGACTQRPAGDDLSRDAFLAAPARSLTDASSGVGAPHPVRERAREYDRSWLVTLRADLRTWAERCGLAVSKDGCDVGDSVLFDGILCLSGEGGSCAAVAAAQDAEGRFWRSHLHVGRPGPNSFSRDMALGVLAYLAATGDVRAAIRWVRWIERNGYVLCPDATDDRCFFTPGFWEMFAVVWRHLGLPVNAAMRSELMSHASTLPWKAVIMPSGFRTHLLAVNVLIRRAVGRDDLLLASSARLFAAREPLNPFYAYLAGARMERIGPLLEMQCPRTRPAVVNQWSFERTAGEAAWKESMGWECIALINLLLSSD